MNQRKFPPNWDEKRVQEVLAHYESQSDEEAAAEDEAAYEDTSHTLMEVPNDLVSKVRELKEPREWGVLILDNTGSRLAKVPNVAVSSAGPYVFRPNGPGTTPVYLTATTEVYETTLEKNADQ
jgi:hypothetical protein